MKCNNAGCGVQVRQKVQNATDLMSTGTLLVFGDFHRRFQSWRLHLYLPSTAQQASRLPWLALFASVLGPGNGAPMMECRTITGFCHHPMTPPMLFCLQNNAAFQGVRSVATTQHTWSDVNNGTALQLRTRLWISLMKANSTTEFDTDPNLAPIANSVIKSLIFSGADNLQNGNATQLAWMNALHFLEEYGGLKSRLPQIYRGRRQPRFYKPRD